MLDFSSLNVCDEIKDVLLKFDIEFVFQPIFSRDNELIGHEALMRPDGRNILDFIKDMEEAGLLHELELVTFFGATLAYRNRNYDKKLCINSLPSECFTVKEAKAYSDCFKPIKDKLVIEILEYTDDDSWKVRTKKAHTKVYDGIEIAIDDFGSGNNGMKVVERYLPQTVKLDRELIANIEQNADNQLIVNHYIKQLHDRGIQVLAEGVETKEEYEYLKSIGVDYFQGFYLARPA